MTSNLDSKAPGNREKAINRSYLVHFLLGMASYIVILVAVVLWGGLEGDSPWRFVWAIAPVLPMLWIAAAMLRHIARIDEYQRLQLLKGFGVGFAVAIISAMTLGFLEMAGLEIDGTGWIIFSAGMLAWALTAIFTSKR